MPWSIPRTTGLTPICQAIVVCILMDIGAGQALAQVPNREAPAPVLPRLGDARTPARTPQPGDATLPLPLPDDASSRRSLPTQSAVSAPSTTPREAETSLPRGDATLGMQLIPGQALVPIDLAGALRLAGAVTSTSPSPASRCGVPSPTCSKPGPCGSPPCFSARPGIVWTARSNPSPARSLRRAAARCSWAGSPRRLTVTPPPRQEAAFLP